MTDRAPDLLPPELLDVRVTTKLLEYVEMHVGHPFDEYFRLQQLEQHHADCPTPNRIRVLFTCGCQFLIARNDVADTSMVQPPALATALRYEVTHLRNPSCAPLRALPGASA